jgi:hypothetical protein
VVVGWLTRLAAVIVLGAVIAFDGISVAVSYFGATDEANNSAQAATDDYRETHNLDAALREAQAHAGADQIVPGSITVGPDGRVSLRLRRQARTLLLHDVPTLRDWGEIAVTGTGEQQ